MHAAYNIEKVVGFLKNDFRCIQKIIIVTVMHLVVRDL